MLYRGGSRDGDAPIDIQEAVYVTTLQLPGTGSPVWVHADGTEVEWFSISLGGRIHRITVDRAYHPDDLVAIEKFLAEAGL